MNRGDKMEQDELKKLEVEVEIIKHDMKVLTNDVTSLNDLCKQLGDLTNELKINTQTNKQILESIKSEHPAKRIGKVEMELESLKKEFEEDKATRKKYSYFVITSIAGAIITAILSLVLI